MKIQITAKNVYGNNLLYPACEISQLLCGLTRKRTFDINDLMKIKKLGYQININGHIDPDLLTVLT